MATNFQTVTLAGQRFVIVPEADFRRMASDTGQLPLPPRDARGNYPAAEALQVSIARSIVRGQTRGRIDPSGIGPTGRHSHGNAQSH